MASPDTKKCPQCAEEIKAEALVCRYCKARFEVTRKGYCTTCHDVVTPRDDGNCPLGHGAVADMFFESRLSSAGAGNPVPVAPAVTVAPAPAAPAAAIPGLVMAAPAAATANATRPPRRGLLVFLAVLGGLIVVGGAILLVNYVLWRNDPRHQAVEVTFDTIGAQADGQLVTIEGYLHLATSSSYHLIGDQGYNYLYLLPNVDALLSDGITIWVPEASGSEPEPNEMASLPISYEYADLRVRLADGTLRTQDQSARITGWYNADGGAVTVDKIEAALSLP